MDVSPLEFPSRASFGILAQGEAGEFVWHCSIHWERAFGALLPKEEAKGRNVESRNLGVGFVREKFKARSWF